MKMHIIIRESFEKGYRVTEAGELIGLKGRIPIKLYGRAKYPTVSVSTDRTASKVYGLPVHLLAAYCFYGEKVFDSNLVVRHLNGVLDVSKVNLVLGTHSENNLDKPKEVREYAAKKARQSQGVTPRNAKLDGKSRARVLELRQLGRSYNYLANLFNVSKSTIANLVNGRTYSESDT